MKRLPSGLKHIDSTHVRIFSEIRINVASPHEANDVSLHLTNPTGVVLQQIPFNPVAGENIFRIKPPAG
jgi:hypothetical protein